jgi:putative endonuclease
VLYRNYRTPRGEIDLICRDGDMLVFVEVRSRENLDFGRPAESIGPGKEDSLRYAAERYLALLGRDDLLYRFDAVEVLLAEGRVPECALIRNLFS